MSVFVIQTLLFMVVTFALGFALAWGIWRMGGGATSGEVGSLKKEMDFWRSNLEQCRNELNEQKSAFAAMREQKDVLKKRLESLEG